jgi:undecaprenyl-phosphate galactose phosphotransferase
MYHNVSNVTHKKLVEEFMNGTVIGAKLRDDPRVTSIGKFIRKHSIDEFAQLINVIKGEMSLVGPRPSTLYEYEQMEDWHKQRFDAMPGMTGLWQVAGRAEVSYTDMIMLDLYYVENRSFWFDIMMLIKTISVVVKGKGGF